MNKDEMKNRISLALKDPILQQGFEIICKELAELEEELQKKANTNHQLVEQMAKQNEEIADLKDYAIQLKQAAVKRDAELTKQLLEFDKERTKAKEIIKELLDLDLLPEIEIKKTAENFIKEESCQISIA